MSIGTQCWQVYRPLGTLHTKQYRPRGCVRCWGLCGLTLNLFVVKERVVVGCACVENELLQQMPSLGAFSRQS